MRFVCCQLMSAMCSLLGVAALSVLVCQTHTLVQPSASGSSSPTATDRDRTNPSSRNETCKDHVLFCLLSIKCIWSFSVQIETIPSKEGGEIINNFLNRKEPANLIWLSF